MTNAIELNHISKSFTGRQFSYDCVLLCCCVIRKLNNTCQRYLIVIHKAGAVLHMNIL